MIETELKYLVNAKDIPKKIFRCNFIDIEQGYISDECDLITEVRVRIETQNDQKKYILAIKKETGVKGKRIEIEIGLSEKDFEEIWTLTKEKRLRKKRYLVPYKLSNENTVLMELDVFQDRLNGHITLEIEERKEGDLENFVPPSWVYRDVTGNRKYSNRNLVFCKLENNKIEVI